MKRTLTDIWIGRFLEAIYSKRLARSIVATMYFVQDEADCPTAITIREAILIEARSILD